MERGIRVLTRASKRVHYSVSFLPIQDHVVPVIVPGVLKTQIKEVFIAVVCRKGRFVLFKGCVLGIHRLDHGQLTLRLLLVCRESTTWHSTMPWKLCASVALHRRVCCMPGGQTPLENILGRLCMVQAAASCLGVPAWL